MVIALRNRKIRKVAVVDDDENVRASYAESLDDLGVEPVIYEGPLTNVDEAADQITKECDAVVTDYVIQKSGYSTFDGGNLAARCFQRGRPVIICTSYSDAKRQLRRSDLRWIPAVVASDQFDHGPIIRGWERALKEIDGEYESDRRGHRTLLRVTELSEDGRTFYVRVMGRSPQIRVPVQLDDLPSAIRAHVKPNAFLHAIVNTGAKKPDDLFFDEWEDK
jgi:CheY-like chemotaxis protein